MKKIIDYIKKIKHYLYYEITHWYLYLKYLENFRDLYQKFRPFAIDVSKFNQSFLRESVDVTKYDQLEIPRNIYFIWTGSNEMSPMRREAVERITNFQSGFKIIMVTADNIENFIHPSRPLHPMYENLSYVHRSDYLRAYLLWAHGGGYTDIKNPRNNWESVFNDFSQSDCWIAGYREIVYKFIPESEPFGKDLKKMSSSMIGQCAFLSRPRNPFLEEWLNEMDRRLDMHSDALIAHPGNAYGTNQGYPLRWTELLAEIIHPLCAKYPDKVFIDKRLKVEYKGIKHR